MSSSTNTELPKFQVLLFFFFFFPFLLFFPDFFHCLFPFSFSDFGLSRLIGNSDSTTDSFTQFYISKSNFGPLKWMAPESLEHKIFSPKSDCWSFGITCIEILTRGVPYPHLSLQDFVARWQEETSTVAKYIPANTPPHLRQVIQACFSLNPEARPNFETIVDELQKAA
jgi:serine/threonine protein kinase